jgi:hypothetical protein
VRLVIGGEKSVKRRSYWCSSVEAKISIYIFNCGVLFEPLKRTSVGVLM